MNEADEAAAAELMMMKPNYEAEMPKLNEAASH